MSYMRTTDNIYRANYYVIKHFPLGPRPFKYLLCGRKQIRIEKSSWLLYNTI
jgi:hypothetical protein